jgi:capsular exopolysaccharide synthesis family protein
MINGLNEGESELLITRSSAPLSEDVRRYLELFWRWAWLIILFGVLAAAGAFYTNAQKPPIFRSTATLLITEPTIDNQAIASWLNERRALTFSILMVQKPVLAGVIDELGLDISEAALAGNIEVSTVESTQLVIIEVSDTDPIRSAQVANSVGEIFARQNWELQASRYQETKDSLNAQLASTELQISETVAELDAFSEFSDADLRRSDLQTKLEIYQQVYEDVLRAQILGTSPGGAADEADVAEIEALVQETLAELALLEGTVVSDVEKDRLEANLALYRQTYANLIQSFEDVRLAEIQNSVKVELVDPAGVPTRPIAQNLVRDTALAALVGMIIAAGIVYLIDLLDDNTFKDPDEIADQLGLPILSLIEQFKPEPGLPITQREPRSRISESFRSLRTNIQYANIDSPPKVIMVTSALPQDGKSVVAANLAIALAQSQREAILIDADLRRPRVHRNFGIANREGLSNLFVQNHFTLDHTLRSSGVPHLDLLTSGGLPPNPAELISSEKMKAILGMARGQAEYLVIDTPPVLAVTDPIAMASNVDGVILVVRMGRTKKPAARQAVQQLQRTGAKILGIVLNDTENVRGRHSYYYNSYYAGNQYYDEDGPSTNGGKKKKRRGERRGLGRLFQ